MKTLKLLFAAAFAACCVTVAEAADPIPYLDWDPVQKQMTNATCSSYVVVTNGIEIFEAGTTYVVNDWVTAPYGISVNGTEAAPTTIILCKDGWLTAKGGVEVTIGHKLVICEQVGCDAETTHQLDASDGNMSAGIGGGWNGACGTIVINGGIVNATGGYQSAGIGGCFMGSNRACGDVTINGGTVNARGDTNAAGIGGANGGAGGTVTINGGMVSGYGGASAAGIGGGYHGAGGTVAINGGMVTAEGDAENGVAGIGAGFYDSPMDPGTVTFGPGMNYRILAGTDWFDQVEVSTAEFIADHSAPSVFIDSWPGYDGPLSVLSGRYCKINLVNDLGILIPDDVDYAIGDKVTVKVEGLAKGLKLVATQQKETTGKKAVTNVIYTIEGVPTETIDFETQPMYARVTTTYKDKTKGDKGKVESLQPLALSIEAPEPLVLTDGVLNEVYGPVDIATLWPEVADAAANPKDWSFKGWPAGLKYNATAKDASWSYKDGKTTVKTTAAPYTVYGTPTKAGEYTLTATHKRKLADGKTTVNETYSAVLTVWGDDGLDDFRYTDQAYVATATKVLSDVTAASGLPTGIKFTKTDASLSGTPTKSGIFAVTLTKTDKLKETFLWRVLPGENDGFLGTMDWEVEDSAVTVMQGVIQPNWNCSLPADAKVTATGLPSGLKLAQDKDTKAWSLSGTPTKEGNYVVTFKTVRNGVTVTERLAIVVEPNEWTGNWYGMQTDFGHRETLGADVTVSANGTVKLVFTEASTNYNAKGVVQSAVKKTTVTVKNLDANGKTATLTLPKDKKDPLSVDRICILDFDEAALSVDGELRMFLGDADTSAPWPDITTVVLEETAGGETNAYGYVTATYKSGKFTLSGKLWDGTAVKGTVYALSDGCVSPVLVTDKAKNAVSITLGTAEDLLVFVRENGELVTVGRKVTNGFLPLSASFAAADLKSKKFNVTHDTKAKPETGMTTAETLVILTEDGTELPLVIPEKDLKASVSAQGLVKFTITDEDGWKWVSELLPINNDGELQFRGIATGTKRNEPTRYRPVWTEVETEDPGVQLWEDGPYWAACNVGAANPEDPGYYFWWGDTGGYRRNADNNGWISVRDSTPFSFEAANVPTCTGDRAWLQSEGYIDSTGNLVAAHDAATAYLGAPWRMPTSAEIDAILDKCDCAIMQQDGKWLFRITGRGDYASNSIVLPAAGYGNEASLFGVVSDCLGEWWSSTYYDDPACPGYANGFSILWYGGDACSLLSAIATPRYGYSIRPVRSAE